MFKKETYNKTGLRDDNFSRWQQPWLYPGYSTT